MTCGLFCIVPVHHRITCDSCHINPIKGNRYKCTTCLDYDLCEVCKSRGIHPHHGFVHIVKPTHGAGQENITIPLTGLELSGAVEGDVASLTLSQTYINNESNEIEAVYVFPMDPKVAMTSLIVSIDGKIIEAQLQEKEKARDMYDDAIASGNGAYLAERSSESKDVFSMSVGRLLPGKTCKISITFVCELKTLTADQSRLTIPTAIVPRYSRQHQTTPYVGSNQTSNLYNLALKLRGTNARNVSNVTCSHDARIDWKQNMWEITGTIVPDRDVHVDLAFVSQQQAELSVVLERSKSNVAGSYPNTCEYAASISVVPKMSNFTPRPDGEYIFLVDCSGSMDDSVGGYSSQDKTTKIEYVRTALGLFLRGLQPGCTFNIVRFGSTFKTLFPESRTYTSDSFKEAKDYVDRMKADLGGTELLGVLTSLLNTNTSKPRTIFLLTDGEVSDTEAVIQLATKTRRSTKIFTIGVGVAPSKALVEGVANATRGVAEFVTKGTDINDAIMKQLKRSMQSYFENITLEWEGVYSHINSRSTIPFLFADEKNTFYAILLAPEKMQGVLTLSMTSADGQPLVLKTAFSASAVQNLVNPGSILALASRDVIEELEEKERLTIDDIQKDAMRKMIIEFSLGSKVACKYTSFVAIETRDNASEGTMILRKIPIQQANVSTPVYKDTFGSRSVQKNRSSKHSLSTRGAPVRMCASSYFSADSDEESCFMEVAETRKSITAAPKDPLVEILLLQQFEGNWTASAELFAHLGSTQQDVKRLFGENEKLVDAIITAFVLMALFKSFSSQRNVWQPMYEKGIKFVIQSGKVDPALIHKMQTNSL